jgi:hypothetical protein
MMAVGIDFIWASEAANHRVESSRTAIKKPDSVSPFKRRICPGRAELFSLISAAVFLSQANLEGPQLVSISVSMTIKNVLMLRLEFFMVLTSKKRNECRGTKMAIWRSRIVTDLSKNCQKFVTSRLRVELPGLEFDSLAPSVGTNSRSFLARVKVENPSLINLDLDHFSQIPSFARRYWRR